MRKAIRLILLICLLSNSSFSQQYSIYQNITTSNGLPSNYVFGVCEDEHGFLWIGTDKGLCRFDGFRWKVVDKDNGLPGNYVGEVLPDKMDGLWLGISEKGCYHFSLKTGAVRLFFPDRTPVKSFTERKDGAIYSAMQNLKTKKVEGYIFHPSNPKKPQLIYSIANTSDVSFAPDWKQEKVYCISKKRLSSVDVTKLIETKWPVTILQVDGINPEEVLFASDSVLITSTEYVKFSKDRKVIRRSPFGIVPLGSVQFSSDSLIISNANIFKFKKNGDVDFQHQLFNSTNSYAKSHISGKGIYVYDIKTGYYFIKPNGEKEFYNKANGLGTDYVNQIYETKNGTIIISTLGAGLQLIKNNYRKTFFTDNKLVRTVIPVQNDWYILAGDRIAKTSASDQSLKVIGNVGGSTLTMFKSGDTVLVGSLKGITFYKNGNKLSPPFQFYQVAAGISSIIKTKSGFLAGSYGNGLIDFNHSSRSIVRNPPMQIIEKLHLIKNGYAALSYEDGVILVDTIKRKSAHLTNKNGLLSSSVYSLYTQSDTLWVGTKGGIALYASSKIVQTIPFASSYKNENAICIFRDRKNKMWVVSNKYVFSIAGNKLQPTASHPLVSEDDIITTASYNDKNGELAIGSNKAFSIIDINAIRPDSVAEAPSLLTIKLDGTMTNIGNLKVPYQFGKIEFEITPRTTSAFSRSHYYYKLSGRDDVWHEVKDSLTISFTALRPGSYQLFTKATNADGFESAPIAVAAFTVSSPFWQQWPFLVFCIVATIGLTALVVKEVEKARRRKKEMQTVLQQSLQNERERISKDLHDHLGANLATIIAQTDNIEARLYKGDIDNASVTVQHLSSQTRETMNVLRETIWAVQEAEHSLDDFIIRMRTFLQRLFESTSINWDVKSPVGDNIFLSPTQTLHLFRVIQEASQNIIKHSQATEAIYQFTHRENSLHVLINDNGKGFKASLVNTTNGLINIKERIKTLNGTVHFSSDNGTSINITFPL